MKKKGFTLIELLVVIAIIAMLMAILMPALGKVRRLAQRLVCGTNLAGLGKSIMLYANDNDEDYPQQGGLTTQWAPGIISLPGWNNEANPNNGSLANVTVSSDLYLLIREADVAPKNFVCKSSDQKEFEVTAANGVAGTDVELTDIWDFGNDSRLFVSYSYHQQHRGSGTSISYAVSTSSSSNSAVLADRNPYLDEALVRGTPTSIEDSLSMVDRFDFVNIDAGGPKYLTYVANSYPHGREGQNVLFNDGSTSFEKTPDVGENSDNIYTPQLSSISENGRRKGSHSGGGFAPVRKGDSLLVSDADAWQ